MDESYVRSDLACESAPLREAEGGGTEYTEHRVGEFTVGRLRILCEDAAMRLGKPCGVYVTVSCGRIDRLSEQASERLARLIAGELRGLAGRLTGKRVDAELGVFVAGLGNAELTADAVGPKTVAGLTATRHLRDHEHALFYSVGCASISALAPGVLGQTGIETLELLQSTVSCVKPDVILVIDALAARSCDRLAATVQISDAGISPGSGVGNHRAAIDQGSVGVPVIALGVPTVVDSSALVYDVLAQAGIDELDEEIRAVLESGKSFFVSPKECDVICEQVASVLSRAIGLAFAGELAE